MSKSKILYKIEKSFKKNGVQPVIQLEIGSLHPLQALINIYDDIESGTVKDAMTNIELFGILYFSNSNVVAEGFAISQLTNVMIYNIEEYLGENN
jgi:hypothetical protein